MNRAVSIILITGLLAGGPARAHFVVDRVEAHWVDGGIRVRADFDLSLSDAAERALDHGVPLIVVQELELTRKGWLWNHVEQSVNARHGLRYYALSGRYVVASNGVVLDSFGTVGDALESIDSMRVTFAAPAVKDASYAIAARSRLDIDALPAPLIPTALFSPEWQLASDWSQWPITGFSTN